MDKTCTKCAQLKTCSSENFAKSKTGKFGYASACKTCQRSAYKSSAVAEPERFRRYARESYRRRADQIQTRAKERKRNNVSAALRARVSSYVRQNVGKTNLGTTWTKLLPYSSDQLKAHLQSLFCEGMSWELFMAGEIEIDHVIPVSYFNPSCPKSENFRMCWSLRNLQPLWRSDNRAKGGSLPANFEKLLDVLREEVN